MDKSDKIPEGNPFKVPENYFEEVTKKIISSTSGIRIGSETKKRGLYMTMRPFIAVAASVALFALLSYAAIKLFVPQYHSLSVISSEEYSDMIIEEIDILTLEQDASWLGLPEPEPQVDKKAIVDFLMLENIDINEIQEQL